MAPEDFGQMTLQILPEIPADIGWNACVATLLFVATTGAILSVLSDQAEFRSTQWWSLSSSSMPSVNL